MPDDAAADPRRVIAQLRRKLARRDAELARRTAERDAALAREAASAGIINVIHKSPGDLSPVFEAILEKAHTLCGATKGSLVTMDGGQFRTVATRGLSEPYTALLGQTQHNPPGSVPDRLRNGESIVQLLDARDSEFPVPRAAAELEGARTILYVPLKQGRALLGYITAYRQEVRPFTDKQIALLENFAAQAVIAMENARLITETRAALEQQTATAEVLGVINANPGDLAPVFDAILEKAHYLCDAERGALVIWDGEIFRGAATRGLPAAFDQLIRGGFRPVPQITEPLFRGEHAQIEDFLSLAAASPPEIARVLRITNEMAGTRTLLMVPLRKDEVLLGYIAAYRTEVRPFTDKQIALLQNFAAQAVIAMENARLITETREALERQTATAEVLQVINSSPGDLVPVFDAILDKAHALCGTAHGSLQLYDGENLRAVATHGVADAFADVLRQGYSAEDSPASQALIGGEPFVHILDSAQIDHPVFQSAVALAGIGTVLFVPLRKEGGLLGLISAARREVRPFTDRQIALLQNFAAQAVIAMENARLITETREALEQQTATAEVLGVINSSPGDLAPVFNAILEKAHALCGAAHGHLSVYENGKFRAVAMHAMPEPVAEALRRPFPPGGFHRRMFAGERVIHVADFAAFTPPTETHPVARAAVDLGGVRTLLMVPLRKDGALLGYITAHRTEVRAFSEKEIALLENFAAQAVIAMENARLITETRAALEQQTATAEVLGVINSSPGDLAPVFDAILDKAHTLCEADFGALLTYDGERFRPVASSGASARFAEAMRGGTRPSPRNSFGQVMQGERFVHTHDMREIAEQLDDPVPRALADSGEIRTLLMVPLRKDDSVLGVITANRREVRPFSDKQIALLENFAAQAVIAMENARLLTELRERTRDLQESLEYQTATSDVLKVISGSVFDLQPVLQTVVTTAIRLCRADQAVIYRNVDGEYRWAASDSLSPAYDSIERELRIRPGTGTLVGRAALEAETVHILDCMADPLYEAKADARVGGVRTMLGVPLLREGVAIGVIGLARKRVEAFTDKEIALVTTFADQAVIAIENTRLLTELRESLEQQQAIAEVLSVINASPGNLQPVFDAILEKAHSLCGVALGSLELYDGESFRSVAEHGLSEAFAQELRRGYPAGLSPATRPLLDRERVSLIADAAQVNHPIFRSAAEREGIHTVLFVPLRRDEALLGMIASARREVRLFSEKEIALLENFAAQAVIAMENARLLGEIRAARDAAENALGELRATQRQLVVQQKMAALGQLTAGIAHEIKNPLNFVNNFAGLSVELLDELKAAAAPGLAVLGDGARAEIDETIELLTANLDKIAEHGRRADGIVKSMLAHSRGGSGEWQEVDLNAIVDEALNLAYHGARAQDQNFNITMERDFDPALAPIAVVPQDVTRVFLNLVGNGFYAANKRRAAGDSGFRPILKVATRDLGEVVEVRVRDNGTGISPEHRERLFQPFFTTKPTGEGTGLGLSISHDIVTQQHGGSIAVDSEEGAFTEFIVRLPRRRPADEGRMV